MYECQVQAVGGSLYRFKRRYVRCGVGNSRPRKEKRAVAERPLEGGLGDIINTQRNVWEAGQVGGRAKDRLKK